MEPFSLVVGAAVFLVGFVVGRLVRRAISEYECTGCRHPLSLHNPRTGACNHMGRQKDCRCLNYTGERPLDMTPSDIIKRISEG